MIDVVLRHAAPIAAGLVVSVLLSYLVVKRLVRAVDRSIPITAPAGVDVTRWKRATSLDGGERNPAAWLGMMETALFFVCVWYAAYTLAAGFLAFKLASKWEVWQSILQVPDHLDNVDPLEYLAARNRWASSILQRWMVGTLGNVLCAFVGFGVARVLAGLL